MEYLICLTAKIRRSLQDHNITSGHPGRKTFLDRNRGYEHKLAPMKTPLCRGVSLSSVFVVIPTSRDSFFVWSSG